jgi:GNAT superfamily N-acetyltransferase
LVAPERNPIIDLPRSRRRRQGERHLVVVPEQRPELLPQPVGEVTRSEILQSTAEQPELVQLVEQVDAAAFRTFMLYSDLGPLWSAVYEVFPEYQLVLRDAATGGHVAHGNMVPFVWDGTYNGLPRSAAEMVHLALEHNRQGLRPTALGALQAVVNPACQGTGVSARMLQHMAGAATTRGYTSLFAPIRPNQKDQYPLVPLANYVGWTRADGLPRDPWQRVHVRLGATPAGVVSRWLSVTASLDEWADWTGLVFPESGAYVIPGGLVPLDVDVEDDTGRYVEPHLWMHYRLG